MSLPITVPVASPHPAEPAAPRPVEERLHLLGRPTLRRFLRWVHGHAVNPPGDGVLADEWEAARQLVLELERTEAGFADRAATVPLGPEYEPQLLALLGDPLIRHGFNTVPTDIALVEMDHLVVYQQHIDVTYARQVATRLGPAPSREDIFRLCLPYDHPRPPGKWSRVRKNTYTFVSPSNDLRCLGVLPLEPQQLTHIPPPGTLLGVVGVAVGFGSNFLNAFRVEGRIILNNGSHRAYALRQLGVTHVPCIVQHVPTRAALEIVAPGEVAGAPDAFLRHPRPPLLKDYFTPGLFSVRPVHPRHHQVTIRFEVEETFLPAV